MIGLLLLGAAGVVGVQRLSKKMPDSTNQEGLSAASSRPTVTPTVKTRKILTYNFPSAGSVVAGEPEGFVSLKPVSVSHEGGKKKKDEEIQPVIPAAVVAAQEAAAAAPTAPAATQSTTTASAPASTNTSGSTYSAPSSSGGYTRSSVGANTTVRNSTK